MTVEGGVVVDACVWGHANNPKDKFFECASEFLQFLDEHPDVVVFFDEGGIVEHECALQVSEPNLGLYLLADILGSGRSVRVDASSLHRDVDIAIGKLVKRRRKSRDRTAVRVAVVAAAPLVTDDYDDFDSATRRALRKKVGVTVCDSCEAAAGAG